METIDDLMELYKALIRNIKSDTPYWNGDEDAVTWIRDGIAELTNNNLTEELQCLDIKLLEEPVKLKDIVDGICPYDMWGESVAFPEMWWANLDRIYNGTYPFDLIPDYLKPAAKQYYEKKVDK